MILSHTFSVTVDAIMHGGLTRFMEGNHKRRFRTVAGMDRMSNLPQHLIGLILERLPIQDAVRTSILSKTWRYIWTTMTLLVFDKKFSQYTEISKTFGCDGSIRIINHVLILHNGPISKFSLHIPLIYGYSTSFHEVDQTMLLISRKSVQELALTNSNRCYELPSCVSSCSELRKLELEKCIFKPLLKFEVFSNLEDLRLNMIDFGQYSCGSLVTLPKLRKLVLEECKNVYNFNIKASQLIGLVVLPCHDAMLSRLLDSPHLILVSLCMLRDFVRVERINLTWLLSNLSKINNLSMDGNDTKFNVIYNLGSFSNEALFPFPFLDELPKWLPRPVDSLRLLRLRSCQLSDLDQLDGALCLLRNSPNLETLYMSLRKPLHYDVEEKIASDHLESPDCLDQTLNRLRIVKILTFDGSRSSLLFIKLLLAHSPSLKKLTIHTSRTSVAYESLNIVMRFPQASPKAKLSFFIPKPN
ncbi:LOW QUALITY PROTEIN: hypothetical protein OSB04_000688 [Centaurea solstitialis]|uniref:F-box domain-containing protein n=1 Tax=Centaurea solstitialis TaxID=347529 RepID=A0AA38WKS2_9ASTR|nr:LOW QUALITY PROTEIN: hypothetical protein OSB04_000688 [Centaurea solstitialis]